MYEIIKFNGLVFIENPVNDGRNIKMLKKNDSNWLVQNVPQCQRN